MKPSYSKLLFIVLLAGAIQASGEDERLKALSEDERVWLEEEVIYIILPQERDVFLSLSTQEERARFVEAFLLLVVQIHQKAFSRMKHNINSNEKP